MLKFTQPRQLRTIPLKWKEFSIPVSGHRVNITHAHPLTNAAQDIFKMLQSLADGECLVLDRKAYSLGVFELKEAQRLDAGEFIIIERPTGAHTGPEVGRVGSP